LSCWPAAPQAKAVTETTKNRAAWKPVLRREVMPFDPHRMIPFFMSQATADAAKPYVRPESESE